MSWIFIAIVRREIRQAMRHGTDTVAALLFFILCVTLFPLSLGPSPDLLRRLAPGVIWVCALLASTLPLERIFAGDQDDGVLDQLLLTGLPSPLIGLAKALAHWTITGLPLIAVSAPLGLMLGLKPGELPTLTLSLALGTPILSLIGCMAAAVVLGARRGGLLLPLLILPLTLPALVFGSSAVYRSQFGLPAGPALDLIAAYLLLCLPLCNVATGAALKEAARD